MTRNVPLHQDASNALMRYRLMKHHMAQDGLDHAECVALLEVVDREVCRTLELAAESLEGIRAITGSSLGLRGQWPTRLKAQAIKRRDDVIVPLKRTG